LISKKIINKRYTSVNRIRVMLMNQNLRIKSISMNNNTLKMKVKRQVRVTNHKRLMSNYRQKKHYEMKKMNN